MWGDFSNRVLLNSSRWPRMMAIACVVIRGLWDTPDQVYFFFFKIRYMGAKGMARCVKTIQAWQLVLYPQNTHKGRRKELTPQGCPQTSTYSQWLPHHITTLLSHTHTHTSTVTTSHTHYQHHHRCQHHQHITHIPTSSSSSRSSTTTNSTFCRNEITTILKSIMIT